MTDSYCYQIKHPPCRNITYLIHFLFTFHFYERTLLSCGDVGWHFPAGINKVLKIVYLMLKDQNVVSLWLDEK